MMKVRGAEVGVLAWGYGYGRSGVWKKWKWRGGERKAGEVQSETGKEHDLVSFLRGY